ncbi:hypothetical protein N7460_007963 [Penicillium canescens]|uniref:Uncharacterized protein n=1 Tax=Penicillium canescens TaxID=5083 RepID=A0AAD6N841_PENCN|nr:hypothetical protein N7460_007963 [Penicillium canescens]
MANAPKPSRSAGRGATKAKSRTSRSRAGSPGSVRSTVSTSKADRNPQSPVAKLHKDLRKGLRQKAKFLPLKSVPCYLSTRWGSV